MNQASPFFHSGSLRSFRVQKDYMIAYAFYWLEEIDKIHFIGLLPERRKNPERITQQSISNFGRAIIGSEVDVGSLFFLEMALDESTGQTLWPEPAVMGLTQAQA